MVDAAVRERNERREKLARSGTEKYGLRLVEDAQVANTIMKQVKDGMNKLDYLGMGIKSGTVLSFGADQKFSGAEDSKGPGVQFDVRGHWKGRVIVRLDPSDTYTLIFGRVRGSTWKVDKRLDDIYAESLGEVVRDNVLGNGIRK
jgi:hypothetical protein